VGLSSNANVYGTCLRILQSRGFELEVRGDPEPDSSYPVRNLWVARKDGFYFGGDNPIELLGLIAVYDHVRPPEDRPYWWFVEGPDVEGELLEAAFPDPSSAAEHPAAADRGPGTE
jgi:hypothetical protein